MYLALRPRHYSKKTEETYRHWVKRLVRYCQMRHHADMVEVEINTFPMNKPGILY